ncbi:sensor histidine kinase [Brevundimonas kwangchunensis]|uniref:histidine kinase n=1 Tax=Brevundimonas kwangchunensis TaxID=322163 RepID=A0ABN1GR64_9CAUL
MIRARSLGLRLLAFAGAAIGAALAVAWLVLGLLFERHLERQLQVELERHGLSLIAALSLDPDGKPVLTARPFDPRFDRPASGLYWRISAPAGELRSRSLWDGGLPDGKAPPATGWGVREGRGPYEPRVVTAVRDIQPDAGGPQVVIEVSADQRPVQAARAAFGLESAIFLAVLWLVLAVAAAVQVRLGLRPLDEVRRELEGMRRSPGARLSDRHPVEIRPLTAAVNDLADARAADVERARRRARDLAHALKTPLTALRLQIDGLEPKRAKALAHSLSLVSGAVDGELARTGAEETTGVPAAVLIDRLTAVIARTPEGQALAFDNAVSPDLTLPMHPDAAMEVLGALIENAARFARTVVRIEGEAGVDGVWLSISDDGPGIPEGQRSDALNRGQRLDQRGSGAGLGLAIAADYVEASGGRLTLGEAEAGGLLVRLDWPA